MADRPILFNDAMVRAILNGTKTQTRRIVKPQPLEWAQYPQPAGDGWEWTDRNDDADDLRHWPDYYKPLRCPYGNPGDRLWVREAWTVNLTGDAKRGGPGTVPIYQAEHPNAASRWRPSIHMPRWASRITLEITAVRVERLQEISAADCWAEGIASSPDVDPTHEFRDLWESINGPGSWDANPWVWVIEFRRAGGGNG